jgi:hypothetical protein
VFTTIVRLNNNNNKGNLMGKWKRCELILTPALIKMLLEHVKTPDATSLDTIIENLVYLGKSGDTLTAEEYSRAVEKSTLK